MIVECLYLKRDSALRERGVKYAFCIIRAGDGRSLYLFAAKGFCVNRKLY